MKRPSTSPAPTLHELITSRIKQHNLSRSEFIKAVGYTKNISKGLRRFDSFLHTLEYPNDDFLRSILRVLEIDGLSFYQSFMVSKNVKERETDDIAKNAFKPHIEVLVNDSPSPWFAAQLFYYERRVAVPLEALSLPIIEELNAVISFYKQHVQAITSENNIARKQMIQGFRYHRQYNYSMEFDTDCILKSIEASQTTRPQRKALGNKMVDMMVGGENGGKR